MNECRTAAFSCGSFNAWLCFFFHKNGKQHKHECEYVLVFVLMHVIVRSNERKQHELQQQYSTRKYNDIESSNNLQLCVRSPDERGKKYSRIFTKWNVQFEKCPSQNTSLNWRNQRRYHTSDKEKERERNREKESKLFHTDAARDDGFYSGASFAALPLQKDPKQFWRYAALRQSQTLLLYNCINVCVRFTKNYVNMIVHDKWTVISMYSALCTQWDV